VIVLGHDSSISRDSSEPVIKIYPSTEIGHHEAGLAAKLYSGSRGKAT